MTIVNGVRLVSNSEVQTFKDCPRKWWLAWHRGLALKQKTVDGVRDTGTRVHVALAAHYCAPGVMDAIKSLEYIQKIDREVFMEQYLHVPVDGEALAKLNSQFDLEHAMVEGYLEWVLETGIDADLKTTHVEQYEEVEFDHENSDHDTKLIAKIDARVVSTSNGREYFIDHKTGDFPDGRLLQLNQQMLHYILILREQGIIVDGALYNTLRRVKRSRAAKPPFYQRNEIRHNSYQIDNYRSALIGTLIQIERAEQMLSVGADHHIECPPRPSRDCSWKCPFFKTGVCAMLDDGSRVDAAIEEYYEVKNPLEYYGGQELAQD